MPTRKILLLRTRFENEQREDEESLDSYATSHSNATYCPPHSASPSFDFCHQAQPSFPPLNSRYTPDDVYFGSRNTPAQWHPHEEDSFHAKSNYSKSLQLLEDYYYLANQQQMKSFEPDTSSTVNAAYPFLFNSASEEAPRHRAPSMLPTRNHSRNPSRNLSRNIPRDVRGPRHMAYDERLRCSDLRFPM